MGKKLFSLISIYCLSGFLLAGPNSVEDATHKEVMAYCAVEYLKNNPESPLTVDHLFGNKVTLVRQISDNLSKNLINLSLNLHEATLVKIITDELCPVISPKPKIKKCCPVPSPKKKQRKILPIISEQDNNNDCGVPATTPPPSPTPSTQKRVTQQIDRLHRQWSTKWKSDGDLQTLLQKNSSSSSRKRTLSK